MQKKIYSLLFVPCFLALCLGLAFLVSCGDSGGGSTPEPTPPPGPVTPPTNPCVANPESCYAEIQIRELGYTNGGDWKLTVDGYAELYTGENDTNYIKAVLIQLYTNDGLKTLLDVSGQNFGKNYQFSQAPAVDISDCKINKYEQTIRVKITISDGKTNEEQLTVPPLPHPNCEDYTLTVNINPPGAGSVSPQSGSYSKNDPVTLSASSNSGYAFYNWTSSFGDRLDYVNPYNITMNQSKTLTANFVESWGLSFDREVNAKSGVGIKLGIVDNAITYQYNGAVVKAGTGVLFVERFDKQGGLTTSIITDEDIKEPSKTSEFITTNIPTVQEIEYELGQYFVVKTGTSRGDWFLVVVGDSKEGCRTVPSDACIPLKIWKAQ